MKNKLIKLSIATMICFSNVYALDKYYKETQKGWFYYEKILEPIELKEEPKPKKKKEDSDKIFMQSIPINSLHTLTATEFRETFERAKDIAVMNPTNDNVFIVQMMNNFMADNATEFANVWQRNLLERNSLLNSDNPLTSFQKDLQRKQESKYEKEFFENNEINYFVFYDEVDDKVLNMKRLLTSLKYKVPTKFISVKEHPSVKKEFNIERYPSLWAVTPNKKKRISNGDVITQDMIIKFTIFQLDETKKGKYETE